VLEDSLFVEDVINAKGGRTYKGYVVWWIDSLSAHSSFENAFISYDASQSGLVCMQSTGDGLSWDGEKCRWIWLPAVWTAIFERRVYLMHLVGVKLSASCFEFLIESFHPSLHESNVARLYSYYPSHLVLKYVAVGWFKKRTPNQFTFYKSS